MARFLIGAIVVLLVIVGGLYILASSSSTINANTVEEKSDNSNIDNTKTFSLTGANLRFYINGIENPDIIVKQGDRIRIEFTSTEGFHDWKVDEFNAATEKVNPEKMTSVEFVADKKGTFEYYCSVGQHRTNGMKGKLIVR